MAIKKKTTIKDLEERLDKIEHEFQQQKKQTTELQTKLESASIKISRFKVFIDEKLDSINIESEIKKLMSSENILVELQEELKPQTKKERAVQVYKEWKLKQKENE